MKKALIWICICAGITLFIAMGVMGIKIFDHDYDIITECYAAMAAWWVLLPCIVALKFIR